MQDAGNRIQETGYRIQDAGYRIQDAGYRIQDTGYGRAGRNRDLCGETGRTFRFQPPESVALGFDMWSPTRRATSMAR